MPDTSADAVRAYIALCSPGLPPGRFEELFPRLQILLNDFAALDEFVLTETEPLPAFTVEPRTGETDE